MRSNPVDYLRNLTERIDGARMETAPELIDVAEFEGRYQDVLSSPQSLIASRVILNSGELVDRQAEGETAAVTHAQVGFDIRYKQLYGIYGWMLNITERQTDLNAASGNRMAAGLYGDIARYRLFDNQGRSLISMGVPAGEGSMSPDVMHNLLAALLDEQKLKQVVDKICTSRAVLEAEVSELKLDPDTAQLRRIIKQRQEAVKRQRLQPMPSKLGGLITRELLLRSIEDRHSGNQSGANNV